MVERLLWEQEATRSNRVTVRRNMGSKENPKTVFGEEAIERGSSNKTWQETLAEEDLENTTK